VFSIILLSFCAFRILEYLLGYFLEIECMEILFCLWILLLCFPGPSETIRGSNFYDS
jgi:hypothetical protein